MRSWSYRQRPARAHQFDDEALLPSGAAEREIRACAMHACAQISRRIGVSEHEIDHALW